MFDDRIGPLARINVDGKKYIDHEQLHDKILTWITYL